MTSLRPALRIAIAVILAVIAVRTAAAAQRYCPVPCSHRFHAYDIGPCQHPCYGPYGVYPCHAAGDAYPCVHPMHPYDYILC